MQAPILAPAIIFLALSVYATALVAQVSSYPPPSLGQPIKAPRDLSTLPATGPLKRNATTPAFTVNVAAREQVRQFYNAVYSASEGAQIDSSNDTANCVAGTESAAFQTAILWRINWFRAMSGIPAGITFYDFECAEDEAAALMMSANNQLQHNNIPSSWSCYSSAGASAAAESNLALGINGPDAITSFIWDYGSGNEAVGHRRWLLYPQTQTMATGDVPAQGSYAAANATWVLDENYGGARPETTYPFVSWPPPGYVPYQVVFPQWSFALSNADLSAADVTMTSNGVPLGVTLQPYLLDIGENALVWYPSSLDLDSYSSVFPFDGADTVYGITITNAHTGNGPQSFSYNVTIFDPAVAGADSVATVIRGTNRASVNENNPYSCTPSPNPATTGYQWLEARSTNGNLTDKAQNGLVNFTVSPSPGYSIITNPPVGSGKCFHLSHTNPVPQLLQLTELLLPAANTTLSFQSLLGYATTNEVARVQISTNSASWADVYTQTGTGASGQSSFATHILSLASCAGQITLVRFDYDYAGGGYYPGTASNLGWCLEDIVIANALQLTDFTTNATASTNFNFVPSAIGSWALAVRPVIFNQFGLGWSSAIEIAAVTNHAPALIQLGLPTLAAGQAQLPFKLLQGAASSFDLLQASQIIGPWMTNAGTVLNTIVPGSSYQFTTPFAGATVFYRVQAH
ncbi:MAG: hypothetical protein ACLQVY_00355 [Limisphaerales bacterium]